MERQIIFSNRFKLMLNASDLKAKDVADAVRNFVGLSPQEYYLLQNGKILKDEIITSDVYCVLRTLGGKGGFGSMLRAIGAQIEKTTNREACRDLSGRRLRDINEEKRLKAWLEKQKERETEAEEKRRKKLERLVAVPKHEFKNSEYENERSELTEKVSEAVEEGFKKANLKPVDPIAIKRKATGTSGVKAKKAALWIADDVSSSSESESESDTESKEETVGKTDLSLKHKGEGSSQDTVNPSFPSDDPNHNENISHFCAPVASKSGTSSE